MIVYVTINTNLLLNALFTNYFSNLFQPQFLAIFRELVAFPMYAAYMSTDW
jgi:hypothetical protein